MTPSVIDTYRTASRWVNGWANVLSDVLERAHIRTLSLSGRMIPLNEAARLAIEGTRNTLGMQMIAQLSADRALGHMALFIIKNGIPVYGVRPPFVAISRVPSVTILNGALSDDGMEIVNRLWPGKRYTNLLIRKRDFRRRMKEIRGVSGGDARRLRGGV